MGRKISPKKIESGQFKIMEFIIDPAQCTVQLAIAVQPPEGYVYHSMKRSKNGHVVIQYIRSP